MPGLSTNRYRVIRVVTINSNCIGTAGTLWTRIARLELIRQRQREIEATPLLFSPGFSIVAILRNDRVATGYMTQRNTPRLEGMFVTPVAGVVVTLKQMHVNCFG
jgi:hypothetical protein